MHVSRTRIRWMTAALAAFLALPCLPCRAEDNLKPPPPGENLIGSSNPNFDRKGRDGVIPGWHAAYGTATVAVEPVSGKKALRVSNHAKVYNDTLIRVEPGYQYGIRIKGKLKNFKFIQRYYGAGFALEEINADKVINGNWYGMYGYVDYKEGTTPWLTAQVVRRPKETTVWLRPAFYVQSEDGSEVWYDDVYVWKEKIPEITVDQTINATENGSFETRYTSETIPNAFDVQATPEKLAEYQNNRICVTDVRYQGNASLRMTGECMMVSNLGHVDTKEAVAKIAVKTRGDEAAAFARLRLLDKDQNLVRVVDMAEGKGTTDWKVYEQKLDNLAPRVQYVQWQFGMPAGAKGMVWFDDLQVNVSSPMTRLPQRKLNRDHAVVDVNCNIRRQPFVSPLNAVDAHNIDRLYSPTIYTAGAHLEGSGRWFQERRKLGFKYIRLHHIFQNNICRYVDGKVDFCAARTTIPEGKEFPFFFSQDKDGKYHFDFSLIHYVLDKSVLIGGCKPIIGLEPVPWQMAVANNAHYKPADMKLWEEFIYQFIKSLVDRYGAEEVKTWMFETGNEPGTESEFHGRPSRDHIVEDFLEMQDYTVAGVLRALPDAFIAGPSGAPFIPEVLEHCADGTNAATGKQGCKLDAISFHGYQNGHPGDMSWRQVEDQILNVQQQISRYKKATGRNIALFNTEFAPYYNEGQIPLDKLPPEIDNHIQAVATMHYAWFSHKHGVSLLTFFFHHPIYFCFYGADKQATIPEFLGQPTVITTHGVFKPVCRAFQMMYMLEGGTEIDAQADVDPIYTLATATDDEIRVLCYNFDVNPQLKYTTKVNVNIDPNGIGKKFQATKYELSETKANSWYLAKERKITFAQAENDLSVVDTLNKDSELKPEDLGLHEVKDGTIHLQCTIPSYGAVLFVLKKAE